MVLNRAQPATITQPPAQDTEALRQVFQTIRAESCPLSYNFHMHTTCSDGRLQPEALIDQAIAIGLKGLAITDHHSVNGYRQAQRWLDEQHQGSNNTSHLPHLWVGMEITAELLGTEVHILCYAFDPDHQIMQPYMQGIGPTGSIAQAERVIAAIHQAQGLAILAHPERYRLSASQLIPAAVDLGIDGVETFYAYNNPNPWEPSPKQTQQVQYLQESFGLLGTCGTDTHGLSLLQRL